MENLPIKKDQHHDVSTDSCPKSLIPKGFFNFPFPFINFTLSLTSIRSDGETTHVKAEEHRFENGQLDSKRFEGTMTGDYFQDVYKIMEKQAELFFKSFTRFLPFK